MKSDWETDQELLKVHKQEEGERAVRLLESYRQVFSGDAGSRVLRDIRSQCHVDTTSMVAGDAYATAFNEGKRAVWIWIKRSLQLAHSEQALKQLLNPQGEEHDEF